MRQRQQARGLITLIRKVQCCLLFVKMHKPKLALCGCGSVCLPLPVFSAWFASLLILTFGLCLRWAGNVIQEFDSNCNGKTWNEQKSCRLNQILNHHNCLFFLSVKHHLKQIEIKLRNRHCYFFFFFFRNIVFSTIRF